MHTFGIFSAVFMKDIAGYIIQYLRERGDPQTNLRLSFSATPGCHFQIQRCKKPCMLI